MNDKSITTSVNNPVETPYIDPSQPGAFLVPSPFPQNELITAHIGAVQPNSDDFPNVIRTFHIQAHRITDSNESRSSVNQPANCEPERSQSDDELHQKSTDSHKSDENKRRKQRLLLFVGLTVLLISITIIIVIAVPLSLRKPSTDRFSKIKAVVQSISSKNDLKNSSSPQSRALHWLVYEDGLNVSDTDFVWLRQRYTMAVLYYSTGGETWTNSLHFLESIHECDWRNESVVTTQFLEFDLLFGRGLSCSPTKSVISIYLVNCNLTGTIPEELGYTSYLQNLLLSFNAHLEGTVPSSFNFLTELENLAIRKTNITGAFPSLRAPNMKNLVLSLNRLFGRIPSLTHLSSLTNLDVTYNSLSGNIPDLPKSLTDIDLSYNSLTGRISSSINSLNEIRTLLLHSNHLTGNLPSFHNLTKLTMFSVIRNSLTGTISPQMWELPQLYLLGLGSNKFNGSLNGIGSARNLQGLSLDRNQFTGSISSDIGRNQLSGTLPETLGSLSNLMFLSVGDNKFTGTIPESFENLTNLVSGCNFNGSIIDNLCTRSSKPYITADCEGGLFCPTGCCTICCDSDSFQSTCRNGIQYLDPLVLIYSLYDPAKKNVSWGF